MPEKRKDVDIEVNDQREEEDPENEASADRIEEGVEDAVEPQPEEDGG